MLKRKIFFICQIMLCSIAMGQNIISLSSKNIDNTKSIVPQRDVEYVDDGVIITYRFEAGVMTKDPLYPNSILWNIDGFGQNSVVGECAYLRKQDSFVVPNGTFSKVSLIDSSYVDFSYQLGPARPLLTDNNYDGYTTDNVKPISDYNGFMPWTSFVNCGTTEYRGKMLQHVFIHPIEYNIRKKTLRAFTMLKYKISFLPTPQTDDGGEEFASEHSICDDFLSNYTINGFKESSSISYARPRNILSKDNSSLTASQDYLIISVPKYKDAVERFAAWKRLMGFNVNVVLRDSWTVDAVQNTVKTIYDSSAKLYYLLIVGDIDDVPAYRGVKSDYYNYAYTYDYKYACMNGKNDWEADIYRGRIPVSSLEEANVIFDKIINYEKSPITDASFYRTGLNCAYFQDNDLNGYADRRFAQTSEEVRNYLVSYQNKDVIRVYCAEKNVYPKYWNNNRYSFGEEIPKELQKPNFLWNGTAKDIINKINDGVFYVLHRDHGAENKWGDPEFELSDINSLTNGNKLPVVFSINCLTGAMNYKKGDCFAETFLKNKNGGAVGVFAATCVSYSGNNDALASGMFDAIWPSPGLGIQIPKTNKHEENHTPAYRLGQILDCGLARMTTMYCDVDRESVNYTKKIFHCLGDPSMMIYTACPAKYENVNVERSNSQISVSLGENEGLITFVDNISHEVRSIYGKEAIFYTDKPGNIHVCVSGHNMIPYIDKPKECIYLQNVTIAGDNTYKAKEVFIGSDVTSSKEKGPVLFKEGYTEITADKIVVKPEVVVNKNAKFKINKK